MMGRWELSRSIAKPGFSKLLGMGSAVLNLRRRARLSALHWPRKIPQRRQRPMELFVTRLAQRQL